MEQALQSTASSERQDQLHPAPGHPQGPQPGPGTSPCSLVAICVTDIDANPCHRVANRLRLGPQWQLWLGPYHGPATHTRLLLSSLKSPVPPLPNAQAAPLLFLPHWDHHILPHCGGSPHRLVMRLVRRWVTSLSMLYVVWASRCLWPACVLNQRTGLEGWHGSLQVSVFLLPHCAASI